MTTPASLVAAGLDRLDERPVWLPEDAVLAFACIPDEILRLPHFLDYHRALGIDRFFVIDNGSTDGSTAFLLAQPDVHVFWARGSYADSHFGVHWLNAVLAFHAPGHWALTVDADELLVYPDCETVPLRDFTATLARQGADALPGFMLDMYGAGPIHATDYVAGMPFVKTCPYFDADGYHQRSARGLPARGGPRHRLFWEGRGLLKPSPVLEKIPLVHWRKGLSYQASTHRIDGLTLSQASCVLLHFKLFSDFTTNVMREIARHEHWDAAAQYATYFDGLHEDPDISAYTPSSVHYEDSQQLIALGLMQDLLKDETS